MGLKKQKIKEEDNGWENKFPLILFFIIFY